MEITQADYELTDDQPTGQDSERMGVAPPPVNSKPNLMKYLGLS